jgi:hypothetical protein
VQPLRFTEAREGLHQTIAEMEEASTYLKNLVDIVTPKVQVDEMYQWIYEVVDMLQNVMQHSWSNYAKASPSPSDCWETHWEQVLVEKQWENNQHDESIGHMEHDDDCYDWRDHDSWEESLIDSEELNVRHMK